MKITAIKAQTKRAGRYSLFIDGKFSFGLDGDELLRLGLVSGQEITTKDIEKIKQENELDKLYDKTLNLLSFRPRSSWEIQDYLKRKKQPTERIEKILNKLSEYGYVNDEDFARRWVENRRLLKPISSLKLKAELKQKRVSDEIINKVLTQDQTDERQVLKNLIERKAHRYPSQQKLMQYLARQGFRYDDIKTALSEYQAGN